MTRMYDEMRICLEGWHYIVWRAKTSFCRLRRDTAIAADCTTAAAAALPRTRLRKPSKKFRRDEVASVEENVKMPGL
jgi:hypothetical protein